MIRTGQEYLDSIDCGRDIWINSEQQRPAALQAAWTRAAKQDPCSRRVWL